MRPPPVNALPQLQLPGAPGLDSVPPGVIGESVSPLAPTLGEAPPIPPPDIAAILARVVADTPEPVPLDELPDLPPDHLDVPLYVPFPLHGKSFGESRVTTPFMGTQSRAAGYTGALPSIHQGIDLASPEGTYLTATHAGTVIESGFDAGLGNYVKIGIPSGEEVIYGHMQHGFLNKGDRVSPGDQVGTVGQTGNATGPHLHFEVRRDGQPVDPLPFLGVRR